MMDSLMLTEQLIRQTIMTMKSTLQSTQMIIEGNRTVISNSLSNIETLTQNLNHSAETLNNILVKTDVFMDSLNQLELSAVLDNLSETSKNLNSLLLGIQQGEGTLGKLLKDDSLYNNLTKTAEDLDKLFVDLRENPKRYVHISVFGKKDKSKKEKEE